MPTLRSTSSALEFDRAAHPRSASLNCQPSPPCAAPSGSLSLRAEIQSHRKTHDRTAGFEGTKSYIATEDLKVAVNAAVMLRRPLLVKGEPGTGKTVLAHEISKALNAPLIEWNIKSTTKAHQGLYEYDAVARLRDGQLGDERVHDIRNYIKKGKLWEALHRAATAGVADRRDSTRPISKFPNDLLQELDRMSFDVYETQGAGSEAKERPIVVITSNNEKELPDAFLRRCFFHYIKFPDRDTMQEIHRCPLPRHPEGAGEEGDGYLL